MVLYKKSEGNNGPTVNLIR